MEKLVLFILHFLLQTMIGFQILYFHFERWRKVADRFIVLRLHHIRITFGHLLLVSSFYVVWKNSNQDGRFPATWYFVILVDISEFGSSPVFLLVGVFSVSTFNFWVLVLVLNMRKQDFPSIWLSWSVYDSHTERHHKVRCTWELVQD